MTDVIVAADALRTHEGIVGGALVVRNGHVAERGRLADLDDGSLPVRVYDGATIVPGMRDAHFHPVAYTALISGVSLKTARNLGEVAARLGDATEHLGPDEPVIGLRLDDEGLAEHRLPTAGDLDPVTGARPALLHRYCGHIAVANSAALRVAGITAATPDPPGGAIDRDASGIPTGVLRETAIELVASALGGRRKMEPLRVAAALRGLAGLGITSIGAMLRSGGGAWADLGDEAAIIAEAAAEIPIRVGCYVTADDMEQLRAAATSLEEAGGLVTWNGVKRFGDGSLGGHTAAMWAPYADQPDTTGLLRLGPLDEDMARAALAAGKDVAIHAIGDRACAAVIDLFAKLVAAGVSGNRLRLEHASVLDDGDVMRLAELGVIASVQPPFLASETEWLETRVGGERLTRTYRFRTMAEAGIVLAGGSDCPVEPPDPWAGIARARDRAGINPDEGLDAAAAFSLYTLGGAKALGQREPLAPGSPADFVIVDRDPVTAVPDELDASIVVETFVGGEAVDVDRSIAVWTD